MRPRLLALTALNIAMLLSVGTGLGAPALAAPVKPPTGLQVPKPALTASFAATPFQIAQPCSASRVIQFFVSISNVGTADSPPNGGQPRVRVADDALPLWSSGASLPAIAHGAEAQISVQLPAYVDTAKMAGQHHFRATVGATTSNPVTVSLSAGCIAALTHGGLMTLGLRTNGTIAKNPPPPKGGISKTTVTGIGNAAITPDAVSSVANVHSTNNVAECRSHGDSLGIGCAAAMSNSWYVLVWDWPGKCPSGHVCMSDADGYRIYFPNANAPPVVVAQGAGYTIQAFDPKTLPGSCVAIAAYKGNLESSKSYSRCFSVGDVTTPLALPHHVDVTLQPIHMRSSDRQAERSTDTLNPVFNTHVVGGTQAVLNGVLIAGYSYSTENTVGFSAANDIRRGAVAFDLSVPGAHAIDFATLHIHVLQSIMGNKYQMNYDWSCATTLAIAKRQFWYDVDWLDSLDEQALQQTGPDINIDVTPWVWLDSAHVNERGFVLIGGSENINAYTEASCQTQYDHVTLEVSYNANAAPPFRFQISP